MSKKENGINLYYILEGLINYGYRTVIHQS